MRCSPMDSVTEPRKPIHRHRTRHASTRAVPVLPMKRSQGLAAVGLAFLAAAVAFSAAALLARQPAFFGVAIAFVALGMVFVGQVRSGR